MTFSSLTSRTVAHHGKYDSRQGTGISRIILHHWAGTSGGDARLTNPNANVSANYILYSDGTLVGQVPEEYRAWTTGGWSYDAPSITIEIQNTGGQKHGNDSHRDSWPISNAAYNKVIALIADLGRRYKWGSITTSRVRAHREFVATACPGGYIWNRMGDIRSKAQAQLSNSSSTSKGTKVLHYTRRDKDARAKGRTLKPLQHLYLNTKSGGLSNAANVVGKAGPYSLTAHVYAKGTPGEHLDLKYVWQNAKTGQMSDHYVERLTFDSNGILSNNIEFKRSVPSGWRVFLRVQSPSSNKNPFTVTLLDSDAYLYV